MKNDRRSLQTIESPQQLVLTYRVLQLQVQSAMSIYSPGISAAKLILFGLASGSGYAAVRLESIIGLALAFIGGSCVFLLWTVLALMGGLHTESSKLLANFDRCLGASTSEESVSFGVSRRWAKKSLKSMIPLQGGIMHFYVIEKASLLIVLKIISENIVFLLVNF